MMLIGYFADGPWSHRALELLVARRDIQIAFICARYDIPDAILKFEAEKMNVPFLTHPNVNSDEFTDQIKFFNCDLFVSMSFNQIFRKNLLDMTPKGIINCHAGKLPFYRGRNVLNWALINDEKEFGVTVHFVDDGIDTGDIIRQKCFPITDDDTYGSLLNRSYIACAELLNDAIDDIVNDKVYLKSQTDIHPLGFYCSSRRAGDENLNWNQSSRHIFNFVRAISFPGPFARCFKGGHEVKIIRVQYLPDAPIYIGRPGTLLAKNSEGFLVKTSDSYVQLVDWSGDVNLKVGDRFE